MAEKVSRRPPVIQELCNKLRSARVQNVDFRHFIPDAVLDEIFEEIDIDLCVQEIGIPMYHHREIMKTIKSGGRKVFQFLRC